MTSTLPARPPKPSDEPDRSREESATDRKPLLELSVAQVVGGALAAMTAAFLGSTLGTGGTIIGAALASVIAGVAGAIYTASLRRTGDHVKRVFVATEPVDASDPTGVLERVDDTQVIPAQPVPRGAAAKSTPPTRGFALRGVFVAVAVFLLAGAGLTGYELLTGHAVAGGDGTTITQVSDSGGKPDQPTPTESTSVEPSAEPTAEATSAAPSEAPEPAPTESAEPTQPAPEPSEASPTSSDTTSSGAGEAP